MGVVLRALSLRQLADGFSAPGRPGTSSYSQGGSRGTRIEDANGNEGADEVANIPAFGPRSRVLVHFQNTIPKNGPDFGA